MPPSDPLSALLDPVRAAAREESTQALDPCDAVVTRSAPSPLSLGQRQTSPGVVFDRRRHGRGIPYSHARDVWRFDVEDRPARPFTQPVAFR